MVAKKGFWEDECTSFEYAVSVVAYFYSNDNPCCFFHITVSMEHSPY
jgi:hypothetical protein